MTTVQHPQGSAAGVQATDRLKWLPGLRTLLSYKPAWLPRDLVAGLVLTALLVPAGMGYAEASGLPPIHGLYATIVPLAAYALFGPSRILVLGPDSSLAPLIAATIVPLAAGDPEQAVALAGMLALMAGGLCVAAGLLRFGFITDVLSKPVRYGYMNGIALTVLVGQLPKLFGFSVDADSLIEEVRGFVDGILARETNRVALLIGIASLVVITVGALLYPVLPKEGYGIIPGTVLFGIGIAVAGWLSRSPRD